MEAKPDNQDMGMWPWRCLKDRETLIDKVNIKILDPIGSQCMICTGIYAHARPYVTVT